MKSLGQAVFNHQGLWNHVITTDKNRLYQYCCQIIIEVAGTSHVSNQLKLKLHKCDSLIFTEYYVHNGKFNANKLPITIILITVVLLNEENIDTQATQFI